MRKWGDKTYGDKTNAGTVRIQQEIGLFSTFGLGPKRWTLVTSSH